MGKNQAYKAMQRSRLGSSSAGPEEVEDGMNREDVYSFAVLLLIRESQVDGSFHSPEWHAARLESLKTSHTVTWEEYKKKQKEEEMRKGELEADKDKMMREYRAQLDAERARKLSQGRNHSSSKSARKKDKKDKDSRKHSSKKRKRSRKSSDSSSSSSMSETSSSDDEERESRRSKSKRKGKKHLTRSKHAKSAKGEHDGPLPLSRFFGKT